MSPRPAPAVVRAVELLDFLTVNPTESFSMSELGRRLAINSASVHAILGVLERAGYVQRHPRHRTYQLGAALVVTGRAALQQHPAITTAADQIDALSAELDVEVLVTAIAGEWMMYVASAGRPQPTGPHFRVGQRVPCAPPYGSVHMAWSSPDEIDGWLDRARPALQPPQRERQLKTLAAIRDRGYAVGLDVGGANERVNEVAATLAADPGREDLRATLHRLLEDMNKVPYQIQDLVPGDAYDVSMISAPVLDPNGAVAVAITVAGLPKGLTAQQISDCAAALLRTSLSVSRRIHGAVPSSPGATAEL
jgi:DNA-binding IclR family transcriptional regulator